MKAKEAVKYPDYKGLPFKEVKEKLARKKIYVQSNSYDSRTNRVIDASNAENVGIKTLGIIDFFVNYLNYKVSWEKEQKPNRKPRKRKK